MKRYNAYSIAVAVCLSGLAGYVDAIGFLELGGYFVSFMSGNSTRLAVGIVQGDHAHVLLISFIIMFFIGGAAAGTVTGRLSGETQQAFAVLLLVTFMLIAAVAGYENGHALFAIGCMAFAMGAENTVYQRDGDIAFGLTYMTSTLVKLGQRIAQMFFGGRPSACLPYLALWLGLIGGGIAGVGLYGLLELHSLWLAALWAAIMTLTVRVRPVQAGEAA